MTLLEKLNKIQLELKVPKTHENKFGGYIYRTNEDILNAVKKIAGEVKCFVTQTDDIKIVGDRVYVVATTTLHDIDSSETISCTGWAREPLNKKGMDESQITGAASSYARKRSASGLFAIDDAIDADSTGQVENETVTDEDLANIMSRLDAVGADKEAFWNFVLTRYKVKKPEELPKTALEPIFKLIDKKAKK